MCSCSARVLGLAEVADVQEFALGYSIRFETDLLSLVWRYLVDSVQQGLVGLCLWQLELWQPSALKQHAYEEGLKRQDWPVVAFVGIQWRWRLRRLKVQVSAARPC